MPRPTLTQLERMLTDAQVAEELAVDKSTVRRWIKAGKISPTYKISRGIMRIPKSAVVRFLETRRVSAP